METPASPTLEKPPSDLETGSQTTATDENVVDWDGPSDPQNPLNWSSRLRYGHVVVVSLLSLVV